MLPQSKLHNIGRPSRYELSSLIAIILVYCVFCSMASEMLLYYGSGSPPCWRAMLVLELKELSYSSKLVSFEKKEHKSEDIMKWNPRGQVSF